MRPFIIHANGKRYKVACRAAYGKITNERAFLDSLRMAAYQYRPQSISCVLIQKLERGQIHEVAEFFGMLAYSCPIEK